MAHNQNSANKLSGGTQNSNRSFIISLFKTGGPCVEGCFCYHCQLSRQYNILFNETKGFNLGVFCAVFLLDLCLSPLSSKICQCYVRDHLRKRYNMEEACCSDCCTVCWCPCCALSQMQWELAIRGDDPGATCACSEADVVAQMR